MKESLETTYKRIEGWLSPKEAEQLFRLATASTFLEGDIVEIGSWKGKSTVIFGAVCKETGKGKVFAIDPHTGSPEHGDVWTYPEFEKNIKEANLEEYIIPIIKTSQEAAKDWNRPIRLLWIDGNHEFYYVKKDYSLFSPHVVTNGIVAFHDALSSPGVKQVLRDFFFGSNKFKNFRFVENIVYAERTVQVTLKENLENLYAFYLWQLYGIYSILYSKGIFRLPQWCKRFFKFLSGSLK